MKISLEQTVGEYENKTGGSEENYVKPFHAYKALIVGEEEKTGTSKAGKPYGFLEIHLQIEGATGNEGDCLTANLNSKTVRDTIGKWAKAVASSNASLSGIATQRNFDTSLWKGAKIGVVYLPQKTADSGYKEDGVYSKVAFAIPYDEVDTFVVSESKYDEWCKKFGKGKYYVKSDAVIAPVNEAPKVMAPIDDDLPF